MSGRAWLLAAIAVLVGGAAIALLWLVRTDSTPTSRPAGDASVARAGSATPGSATASPPGDAVASSFDRPRDAQVATPEQLAARDDRETTLATLRESGDGHEEWAAHGTQLLTSLVRDGGQIYGAACYVAGCGATFVFPSDASYRRALDALQASEPYRAWTGGKKITPPEYRGDGTVAFALVFYRPD